MKLLSIAIPCYNSEKYMRKCIDSLLVGGEDVYPKKFKASQVSLQKTITLNLNM